MQGYPGPRDSSHSAHLRFFPYLRAASDQCAWRRSMSPGTITITTTTPYTFGIGQKFLHSPYLSVVGHHGPVSRCFDVLSIHFVVYHLYCSPFLFHFIRSCSLTIPLGFLHPLIPSTFQTPYITLHLSLRNSNWSIPTTLSFTGISCSAFWRILLEMTAKFKKTLVANYGIEERVEMSNESELGNHI